ncbi:MAG: biosynthetic-type acetolactate synthase large subunit [Actinomycetes bacterium]|jgi:acetolactate synthase-1/2/3 large subunit|nr:biosynthetic-type acetolactate synthase large subunit [Acidimicrobiia bacterium]
MSNTTGAHILLQSLAYEGVEVAFGVPGGAILPFYDTLYGGPIRHILARHEQGAGHMAEGYAWATGRVGVCIATSGPGATNLVTPLADALVDSVPMVAITGQVPTTAVGNDAFQEAYTTGITMPATKHNYFVTDPDEIPQIVHEAFHIAATGRPGPVLIDFPKDILNAPTGWTEPNGINLPGYKPTVAGHVPRIREAAELIAAARRPVLYVGGGIIKANAAGPLRTLAERTAVPVTTTLMGRGAFPDDHPLALGMPGMHGTYAAISALQRADLLIAIGVRFDDRVTGDPATFAPEAKVIHVDVDPAEIGKVRHADVPIVGDARRVIEQLIEAWGDREVPNREPWMEMLRRWQREHPLRYTQDPDGPVKPQYVIEELHRLTGGDAILVSGVGQHQMWASQYWKFDSPRRWINSGGLGTMGFGIPAAVGAKAGMPDELVIAVDGDGCFQMTSQELITAAVEGLPIKVVVFNNGVHGMVTQWQRLFYEDRFSASRLGDAVDYVKLAEAMGCHGFRATTPDEVTPTLEKALSTNDRPVVIEVVVDPEEMVFPMVPAGGSCDEVFIGRNEKVKLER